MNILKVVKCIGAMISLKTTNINGCVDRYNNTTISLSYLKHPIIHCYYSNIVQIFTKYSTILYTVITHILFKPSQNIQQSTHQVTRTVQNFTTRLHLHVTSLGCLPSTNCRLHVGWFLQTFDWITIFKTGTLLNDRNMCK